MADTSLNWIQSAGCKVMNLLCKGSYKHVTEQLRKTPEQHIAEITEVVYKAQKMGIEVNVYLEDWSNGMLSSPNYVFKLMDNLCTLPIRRFMLPDTLGILNPKNTYTFCKEMRYRAGPLFISIFMRIMIMIWLWPMFIRLFKREFVVFTQR